MNRLTARPGLTSSQQKKVKFQNLVACGAGGEEKVAKGLPLFVVNLTFSIFFLVFCFGSFTHDSKARQRLPARRTKKEIKRVRACVSEQNVAIALRSRGEGVCHSPKKKEFHATTFSYRVLSSLIFFGRLVRCHQITSFSIHTNHLPLEKQ